MRRPARSLMRRGLESLLVTASRLAGTGETSHIGLSRLETGRILKRKISMWSSARGIGIHHSDRSMRRFRGIHGGRRGFILGNGPSLNECDLAPLADEITFGVNAIYLNRDNMGFDPTYYVVEDIFVAEDRADEIREYRGPHKFIGKALKYCLDGSADTVWMNVRYDFRPYPDFPRFSLDCERELWVGGTVSYLCLQLALYMGLEEVYLVGFDHSYAIKDDVKTAGRDIVSTSDDPNHFHPDYFGKGKRWHDPRLDRMEAAYLKARKSYEAHGRSIFNATVGGKLEVFDRADYSSLFAGDDQGEKS